MQKNKGSPVLSVRDLRVYFRTDDGLTIKAVDGVDFDLYKGETLGIVGESGSGKSVANLSLMGLVPIPPGKIESGSAMFDGVDLLKISNHEMQKIRGNRISMIFQDPMTALNPFLTIATQITEVLIKHRNMKKKEAFDYSIELLGMVGIPNPEKRIKDYPHEFSGGMRQRVMIAIALACDPEILIADEPTSALDVTIQAQIIELIQNLSVKLGTAVIIITHDLGVVAGIADEVVVMYAGQAVEQGNVEQIFHQALHPYTEGLIKSVPRLDASVGKLYSIPGQPPNITNTIAGCPFYRRCSKRTAACKLSNPTLMNYKDEEHYVRCHLY